MFKKHKFFKNIFIFLFIIFPIIAPSYLFSRKQNQEKSALQAHRAFKAHFVNDNYRVRQGRTVRAQVKTNKKAKGVQVKFLSKVYNCLPNRKKSLVYECYIPIECEGKTGKQKLLARAKDRDNKWGFAKSFVNIKKVKFTKSIAFNSCNSKANLRIKSKLKREKKSCKGGGFSQTMKKYLKRSPKKPLWTGSFGLPTKVKRYSTLFGEIRYAPNWGRYLHKAVDIVAPPRYPIWASHNGKVVVKGRHLYSGNTVILDHGHGVFTYYYHLDSFGKIKVGDYVKKGKMIGRVGNTGRSTGYHLHWGLSVNNEFVDPVEWTTKKFD